MSYDQFKDFGPWAKLSVPVLIAAAGGVVRVLQRDGQCSVKSLFVGAITSMFAGVCVHLLITDLQLSEAVKAGIVGVSGFASGDLLRALSTRACKIAKGGK
ncbi:phage holin family protein [Maridesulfovibrio bastinii]|uniref:phage holin family protein n=1 Tax=Maridesulfovibrio bastinii TaxID=47157 RepID=UPI0004803A62|nr:phage holin family protein [Maridesulfovibrio bastinii]